MTRLNQFLNYFTKSLLTIFSKRVPLLVGTIKNYSFKARIISVHRSNINLIIVYFSDSSYFTKYGPLFDYIITKFNLILSPM